MNTNNIAYGLRIRPTSERKPDVVETSSIAPSVDSLVLEAYKFFKEGYGSSMSSTIMADLDNHLSRPLKPIQINSLLHILMLNNESACMSGWFISNIITHSYDRLGETEFLLNLKDNDINSIGDYLEGTEDKRIKLVLKGTAKDWTALNSCYVDYIIDSVNIHNGLRNSSLLNDSFGSNSHHNTYEIINSFDADIDSNIRSCIFRTRNEDIYNKLKKIVPRQSYPEDICNNVCNKVVLLK